MFERVHGPARGWVAASWTCSVLFFVLLAYDVISGQVGSPAAWLVAAMAVTLICGAAAQLLAFRREHRSRSRSRTPGT